MGIRKKAWVSGLAKLARATAQKTEDTHREVVKKRTAKKEAAKASGEKPATPKFDKPSRKVFETATLESIEEIEDARQTQSSVVNWGRVRDWFSKGIARNNKDWFIIDPEHGSALSWDWAEKNCAERLLRFYGEEIVEKTVAWFCDNWQGMKDKSNGKLGGAPSVKFLWSMRERYFAEAKEGVVYQPKSKKIKKHMVGEYNAESANKMPRVGWGDV